MSVQVSYKKQFTLGIIGILILFVSVELFANAWWFSQINCEFENNEIFQHMNEEEKRQICYDLYDVKTSGNLLVPNQESHTLTINSFGFRGEEISFSKPENTYRIFMLGGSTMFGHGATSDKTTIPGHVQEILRQDIGSYKIEVINAGVQGADSFDELNILEIKVLELTPNLIFVYDGWNDLREQNSHTEISENWKKMCEIGNENGFDVVISLQPIAGFGKKSLTVQEQEYARTGTNYGGQPLINFLKSYDVYHNELESIKTCSLTLDFRDVFDSVNSAIYWDQGHISDYGNSVVANSIVSKIQSILPENYTSDPQISDLAQKNESQKNNQFQFLLAGYKTPIMLSEIFSFKIIDEQSSKFVEPKEEETNLVFNYQTNSVQYNEDEISIEVQISKEKNNHEKKSIEIQTINQSTGKAIPNVTYFIKIFKSNQIQLSDFFYAENNLLKIDVESLDSEIKIFGNRQYDHNAFINDLDHPILIKGDFLRDSEEYRFDIELRTIYDKSNWIFSLDGLVVDISI